MDAGARSSTTDTLVLSLIRSTSFYVDQHQYTRESTDWWYICMYKYMHNSECHKGGYLSAVESGYSESVISISVIGWRYMHSCA
jgi:hypothetical protein